MQMEMGSGLGYTGMRLQEVSNGVWSECEPRELRSISQEICRLRRAMVMEQDSGI